MTMRAVLSELARPPRLMRLHHGHHMKSSSGRRSSLRKQHAVQKVLLDLGFALCGTRLHPLSERKVLLNVMLQINTCCQKNPSLRLQMEISARTA